MKHQYFGDINNYRKYGLLRILQRASGLRLGVFWMLTPNDGRTDGKFITYLEDATKWRSYDSELFDTLGAAVASVRHLGYVEERNMLPAAKFFADVIPDDRDPRTRAMEVGFHALDACELLFFDPDNGMEVKSCAPGTKDSSKYLSWSELRNQFHAGKSVLVYQHFRREERTSFISRFSEEFKSKTGCESVFCFKTSNVAFFLLTQSEHDSALSAAATQVAGTWHGQIEVIKYHNEETSRMKS